MRTAALLATAIIACASFAHAADRHCSQSTTAAEALSWLAGEWIDRTGKKIAHQYWSGPLDGSYVGHEVVTSRKGQTSFAFLRIARTPSGFSLYVSLNGEPPFELKAIEVCNAQLVFEGRVPGYPRRITYVHDLDRPRPANVADGGDAPEERQFRNKFPYPFL